MTFRRSRKPPHRVFLLSPADCGGQRAKLVLAATSSFPLARRLREPEGAPIGEVFAFLSGLYFRGKLAYGRAFANPPDPMSRLLGGGVLVITPSAGLRGVDTPVTIDALRAFASFRVSLDNLASRAPLETTARAVADEIGPECQVVLLGSIASPKYVDVLLSVYGERLVFPAAFVGRGDMSRGGLLLRQVTAGRELEYVPVRGAVLHGPRPAKLEPIRRSVGPRSACLNRKGRVDLGKCL
jgi:hypothetical protein